MLKTEVQIKVESTPTLNYKLNNSSPSLVMLGMYIVAPIGRSKIRVRGGTWERSFQISFKTCITLDGKRMKLYAIFLIIVFSIATGLYYIVIQRPRVLCLV